MTTKNHSNYLKFLTQGYNLLLIGSSHYSQYNKLCDYFSLSIRRKMTKDELSNLSATVMNNNIDIAVIDFTQDYLLAKQFYKKIKSYESRIVVIAILPYESHDWMLELLKNVDSFLFDGFSINELKDKIFMQLSLFYTIKSIGRRELRIESGNAETGVNLDEFFDMYEGSSIFIVDELVSLNKALKSGDLSPKLLDQISVKLLEISETFSKNSNVSDIASIFKDFSVYLKELDFSSIKPESLHAFDYICAIIDDTIAYVMDMFVDRVFKDTDIVKHSLESNIEFMKNVLEAKDPSNDGELEFF